MRTKTTILTAALIAAGVASSMAQSQVYSLNIVGYIQVTLQQGQNLVSCPLIPGTSLTNSINSVLTNIVVNTGPNAGGPLQNSIIYFFQSGALFGQFAGGDGNWYEGDLSTLSPENITPAQGFFINNQEGGTATMTLTGTVLTGTNSFTVNSGYNLYGSFEPIVGDLITNLDWPVNDNDQLLTLNTNTGTSYNTALFGASPATQGGTFGGFYDGGYDTQLYFSPNLCQGWLYLDSNGSATWTQILNP